MMQAQLSECRKANGETSLTAVSANEIGTQNSSGRYEY